MPTPRGRKGQSTLTGWLAAFVLLAAFGLPRAAHGAFCHGAFDFQAKGFCSTTTNQGCQIDADCPAGETCNAFDFFDPGDPKGNGGNQLRVNLAIGTGSLSVGTPPQLTVNRIRFDLACVANSGGPPCTGQANVVQYGGDATITTNCGVTWTSSTAQGGNEIVFNASQPIVIGQNCNPRGTVPCGNCELEFTVLVQGQEPSGSDATPQRVEEVGGYILGAGDATCGATLQAGNSQTIDLPICPSCTLDQCNLGCDQTSGTCMPQEVSTPCTDTDGNACTTAGCNGQGVCDQNHSTKVCPSADECNGVCDTTSGKCTPKVSDPCTDTDGNTCTTAGCELSPTNRELGVCVQTHMFASNSTPCADTDGNACTTAGCDGQGTCDQNHMVNPGGSTCASPLVGAAGDCTVLELDGSRVHITGAPGGIVGNICIGPNGHLSITGDEFVTGKVRLASGATLSKSGSGTVGGVQNGVDLSAEINAAIAASADAAGRPCTINLDSIMNATTINATGGGTAATVVCVKDVVLNGRTVTLSGVAGDSFIINVTGKFVLNGGSRIVVNGIQPKDVLYNIIGSGGQVAFTGGGGGTGCCKSSVDGTLIALERNIALSPGLVNGELIGGQNISIVAGSSVKCPPSPCVPNP